MQKNVSLSELGDTLRAIIKKKEGTSLSVVAREALGITYPNFSRRLTDNSLKVHELVKIFAFLGMEVELSLGDIVISNEAPKGEISYEKIIAEKDQLLQLKEEKIGLQQRIIELQEELKNK